MHLNLDIRKGNRFCLAYRPLPVHDLILSFVTLRCENMELIADNETLECPQDWTFEKIEFYKSMKFWIGITICIFGFTGIILNIVSIMILIGK